MPKGNVYLFITLPHLAGCSATTGWQRAHTHMRAPVLLPLWRPVPGVDGLVAPCHITSVGEHPHQPVPLTGTMRLQPGHIPLSGGEHPPKTQPERADRDQKGFTPWWQQQSGSCLDAGTRAAWLEHPPRRAKATQSHRVRSSLSKCSHAGGALEVLVRQGMTCLMGLLN